MAKKIIAFLSDYKDPEEPKNKGRVTEEIYKCPDGSEVKGTQTNEAPLLYLLKKHSDVSEVLCIVTEKAVETLEYLESVLDKPENKKLKVPMEKVEYHIEESFTDKLLPKIMEKVKEGDEILLETTGGPRNAVMELLLLSRALSYAGVKTVDAVYSNFGKEKKEIEDVTHMIRFFDLIGGMQEMMSFGNVSTLRQYYGTSPDDEKIEALLTALEDLSESIMLCRTKQIGERLETFNTAMKDAENCEDPMMRALLPAFSKKYGTEMDIPTLIKWCADSGMLQQAVTIYTERIPAYLMDEKKYIKELMQPVFVGEEHKIKGYEDIYAVKFTKEFLCLSEFWGVRIKGGGILPKQIATLEYMEDRIGWDIHYEIIYEPKHLKTVCTNYLYIKTIRNMINHAKDSSTNNQKSLMKFLKTCEDKTNKYVSTNQIGFEQVRKAIMQGLESIVPTSKELKKQ